jgi:hypothetical protein
VVELHTSKKYMGVLDVPHFQHSIAIFFNHHHSNGYEVVSHYSFWSFNKLNHEIFPERFISFSFLILLYK